MIWEYLAAFAISAIVDVLWTNYTVAAADRKPGIAAFWSMMILLCGNLSLLVWLDNHWVVVTSAAGGFLGTYLAVNRHKKAATSAA